MNPTPQDIKDARKLAGLTQREAAALIYLDAQTWAKWEQGVNKMAWGPWELFNIKVKQLLEIK